MATDLISQGALQRLREIAERFASEHQAPSLAVEEGGIGTWPDAEPADLSQTLQRWRARHGLPLQGPDREMMDTSGLGLDPVDPPDKVEVRPWHEDAPGLAPIEGPAVPEDFPEPPQGPLSKKVLREFWNDAWTDEDGVHWQVRLQGPATDGKASGIVIREDEVVGKWDRQINLKDGIVQHSNLFLAPEAQGQGFAGAWLQRCAQRYASWDLKQVRVFSGLDGTYTWARKGFDLSSAPDRDASGNPCAYEQSAYAQQMRGLLSDARSFWMSGEGEKLGVDLPDSDLDWLYEQATALMQHPPRLPELAQLEPAFTKYLLRASRVNLVRQVEDMLPRPDLGL